MWGINNYLHVYHLTADVCLALIWQVTDKLYIVVHIGISENHFVFGQFCDISGFSLH